jgi:hypothetical protein
VERRDHARAHGVAVERELHLAVDAVEALLREPEARGVLVEPLEHGPERRLGLLASKAVHAQPCRCSRAELAARGLAGGQLAELLPPLFDERARARLVAVERRSAPTSFVDDVELDLGAGLQVVG